MKKIVNFICAIALAALMWSCTNDGGPERVIYSDSVTLENVTYSLTVNQKDGLYSWTVANVEPEQSKTYVFNYDYKDVLILDYKTVLEVLDNLAPLESAPYVFRFVNDEFPKAALITKKAVKGKVVAGVDLLGGEEIVKSFDVPYDFFEAAYKKINPQK